MLSDEVTAALARFFEGGNGPSHDELDRLIHRAGLSGADPRRDDPVVGKMKRIRAVLWYASESNAEAGSDLVRSLIAALRAAGCFRPGEPSYPGEPAVEALRSALAVLGYDLRNDGTVTSMSMEGLEGAQMTDALWAYVRRARTAGADEALRIGTSKELTEATSRHVLVERIGTYPTHGNFPTTLWQAFTELGLSPAQPKLLEALPADAWEGVEQCLFLLACAVNRYRNEVGTGHGRPHPCLASASQGRVAAESSALVSELILLALAERDDATTNPL